MTRPITPDRIKWLYKQILVFEYSIEDMKDTYWIISDLVSYGAVIL
jgi:hypothetical protein